MFLRTLVQIGRQIKTKSHSRTGSDWASILIIDVLIAFFVSVAFIFAAKADYLPASNPVIAAVVFAAVSAVFLVYLQTQRFIWRFVSVRVISPFSSAALLSVFVGLVLLFAVGQLPVAFLQSREAMATFAMNALLHTLWLAGGWLGIRYLWRFLQDFVDGDKTEIDSQVPVLLVSAGVNCFQLLRWLEGRPSPIRPVGVLDFDPGQAGREIRSIPILGSPYDLEQIVGRLAKNGTAPVEVVFTAPLAQDQMVEVINRAVALRLKVSRLTPLDETAKLVGQGLSPTEPITLRTVLGRQPLELDPVPIREMIAGKRILVTGAGGSIGSKLVQQIAAFGPADLCLIDNSEYNLWQVERDIRAQFPDLACHPRLVDVRDKLRLGEVFSAIKPHLVFHAAALKHVPMVEANPGEAVMTNVVGTMNVADAALAAEVEAMVQVSTDKAVMPTSVMGATKRMAEIYCQALDLEQAGPRFMTVRFGNVLGSSGSVVPIFEKQIREGGPVTVTHPEMERYFMTISEACELILHSAAHGVHDGTARGVINVLDMGKPVKIVDVARRMILLHGLRPDEDIKIEFTGIRPGEKLSEELFNETETPLEGGVLGVHTALSEPMPVEQVRAIINDLAALRHRDNDGDLMSMLERFVPGFNAQNGNGNKAVAA